MKLNRRSIAAGLTVGVLAGGAGGALAATTSVPAVSTSSTTSSSATGWERDGYSWGGAGWRGPQTGVRWGGSASDPNIGSIGWLSVVRSGRQAAQTYLGLSGTQLRSLRQSGKTLAQIASGQGKSVAGLENAIESAVTDGVNADSALTASQRSSVLASLTGVVESLVTGTWDGAAGPWHGGGAGPMTSGGW
jgi:hypothetical protein